MHGCSERFVPPVIQTPAAVLIRCREEQQTTFVTQLGPSQHRKRCEGLNRSGYRVRCRFPRERSREGHTGFPSVSERVRASRLAACWLVIPEKVGLEPICKSIARKGESYCNSPSSIGACDSGFGFDKGPLLGTFGSLLLVSRTALRASRSYGLIPHAGRCS